jgi:hypothetical protein
MSGLCPFWFYFIRLQRYQGYAPFYFDISGYKDVRATPLLQRCQGYAPFTKMSGLSPIYKYVMATHLFIFIF